MDDRPQIQGLEPLRFGSPPTPVRPLPGLSEGDAEVWLKDDGAYSPFGGNKARKLEWLLADARRRGRRTVLTSGALGTNHGLSTALLAREAGLATTLVLVPQPLDDHVRAQLERIRRSGARLYFPAGPRAAYARAPLIYLRQALADRRLPYYLPPGGSTPLGCVGYVAAGLELAAQVDRGELPEPSHAVLAVGSGGTAAGLALGLRAAGLRTRVTGILVNDVTAVSERRIARLATRTARVLRRGSDRSWPDVLASELDLHCEWLGPGYGHPIPAGDDAIARAAVDGVRLEPVYTAKAVAALRELYRRGAFGAGPVLYWHTYSPPG